MTRKTISALKKNIRKDDGKKFHFTLKGVRFCGCLFLLFLWPACKQAVKLKESELRSSYKKLHHYQALLKSGDIIFRNGTDEVSQATRRFNRKDTTFSHCGIIEIEQGGPVVYHAIGGSYNPGGRLKKEPLDSFSYPGSFDKIAVFRYNLSKDELDAFLNIIRKHHENKLPFDLFFNFDTDQKMYCTEFVFKSLNQSMNHKLDAIVRNQEPPVFIATDDLFLNDHARKVFFLEY